MAKIVTENVPTNDDVAEAIRRYNQNGIADQQANLIGQQELAKANPTLQRVDVHDANRATTYEDLYKQYYDTPMSKEEEDRRKRAATAVNGIAGLGNVANAFANLIYTGKGAPNMTLPTYKGADLQAFSDKAAQARRLYADAQIKGRQLDDNAYNQALQLRNQEINQNNNVSQQEFSNKATLTAQDRAVRDANRGINKDLYTMAAGERTHADQRKDAEISQRNQKESLSQGWARINMEKQKQKDEMELYRSGLKGGSRSGYGRTTNNDQIVFDSSGYAYRFKDANKNKNYAQIQSIMNMMNKAGYQPSDALRTDMSLAMGDQQKTLAVEERMIAEYLNNTDDSSIRDQLIKAGVLESIGGQNPSNGNGFSYSGKKGGSFSYVKK